ncbi:MAG: thiolase family protein, partial [Proteobacteria bacterium]|nr:thiolase family protein [Pseudomonadota bacterium]
LTGQSLKAVLKDADLSRGDIEAAWFGNSTWGVFSFQHGVRGPVALSANGIEGVPITNVENACATGACAFHGAYVGIKSGMYDCILAMGTEKLFNEDRGLMMMSIASGSDVDDWDKAAKGFEATKELVDTKEGDKPKEKKSHSPGMDMYASGARVHMNKYGTTRQQLAIVAAKAHNNSVMNPNAQYTFPMTVEEVLNDREISYPLTRAMCAPMGDGSAAAILCSERFLKKHPSARAVKVSSSVLKSGKRKGGYNTGRLTAQTAYDIAGVGPEDVNILEVHDATAIGEITVLEDLGICPQGQGGPYSESGATALNGKTPVNAGGGLIARGHPLGATGLAQIHELVTQLRGEGGERQVLNNPKIGLAENGGGFLGDGPAALCVSILER